VGLGPTEVIGRRRATCPQRGTSRGDATPQPGEQETPARAAAFCAAVGVATKPMTGPGFLESFDQQLEPVKARADL
jgi:hypothetical protein